MTRYKPDRAESTRREILESATGLFRRHGVNDVSLSRIMGGIGMTPGGFYKYFESKEALAGEVCSRAFRQSQDAWSAVIDRARQEAQCPMRSLISEYLRFAEEGHCPMLALGHDASGTSHDQSFTKAYTEGSRALLDILVGVSRERYAEGAREQALVLFVAMLGAGLLSRATGSEEWVGEIEDALLGQLG